MSAPSRESGSLRSSERPAQLSVKANMLWNSLGSMTYLVCQWLITIVVVRLSSGYEDAGLLSLAMSVVGIFGTVANYKMGTYQVSDIMRENSLGEYLGFRCLTLSGSFVLCIIYAWVTCSRTAVVTVTLFYMFKAVGLVIDVLHGEDQINRRMDYIGKSFMLQGFSTLIAFVVVYGCTHSLDLSIIAMLLAASMVLVLFDVPHSRRFSRVTVTVSVKKSLFFLRTSLPAVIASVAASAIFTIPKQYLAMVSGDAALGIYASVAAPALVIQMGAQYLYVPLLDLFPRLFFEGNRKGFLALLFKTVIGVICVAVVCSIALEFFGGWALQLLFGESIASYVYLLQPVVLSTAINAFLWFFGDLLITIRCFKANFVGNIIAFLAVIPLSFACINVWDINGVSFASAGACMLGVLVLVGFLIRMVMRGPVGIDHRD